MEGSVLPRFKTAYIAQLNAALVTGGLTYAAAYDTPNLAKDVYGPDGIGVAAWIAAPQDAAYMVNVLKGLPCWLDETAHLVLVIQSLGYTTDDTQTVVDARANTMLGYAIAVLEKDPSVGLVDDTIEEFTALPIGGTMASDVMNDLNAARFDLRIEIQARLKLTLP